MTHFYPFLVSIVNFFIFTITMPMVHIFGDSHAVFSFSPDAILKTGVWTIFQNNQRHYIPFSIHWLGPITMHRVGRDGLIFLDIRNYNIQEKDTIIFVFGEIDVRCHIRKQCELQQCHFNEIIEELVSNYLKTININRAMYKDLHCIIFNIVPPSDAAYNPDFPFYGTLQDRVQITYAINNTLKHFCNYHEIDFLEINDLFMDAAGALRKDISDGTVHIHPQHNHSIKERLLSILLKNKSIRS